MNKKHRTILAALAPAADEALKRQGHGERPPGLMMHARPSASAAAELMIYGVIGGGGWFEEGIAATDVAAALAEAGPGPINVRLNSPGGDVFDGIAIHTLLARHPGTVTCYVDGLAASAASFIMLAGDRIVSARNAMIMIHDGMTGVYGGPATIARTLELLTLVSDNIADIYAEKAGEDADYWRAQMSQNGEDGTWFTGQSALDAGLVDELTAVPDDVDEDMRVAGRLTAWVDRLPVSAREFISAHPVETDDEPDADVTPDAGDVNSEPEISTPDDEPAHDFTDDFAHRMRMTHWFITSGHTASKEAA